MKSFQNCPASCSASVRGGGARSTRSSSKPSALELALPRRLGGEDDAVAAAAQHVADADAVVRRPVGALGHEQDREGHHALLASGLLAFEERFNCQASKTGRQTVTMDPGIREWSVDEAGEYDAKSRADRRMRSDRGGAAGDHPARHERRPSQPRRRGGRTDLRAPCSTTTPTSASCWSRPTTPGWSASTSSASSGSTACADPAEKLVVTIRSGLPHGPDDPDVRLLNELGGAAARNRMYGAAAHHALRPPGRRCTRASWTPGPRWAIFTLTGDSLVIARNLVALEDAVRLPHNRPPPGDRPGGGGRARSWPTPGSRRATRSRRTTRSRRLTAGIMHCVAAATSAE